MRRAVRRWDRTAAERARKLAAWVGTRSAGGARVVGQRWARRPNPPPMRGRSKSYASLTGKPASREYLERRRGGRGRTKRCKRCAGLRRSQKVGAPQRETHRSLRLTTSPWFVGCSSRRPSRSSRSNLVPTQPFPVRRIHHFHAPERPRSRDRDRPISRDLRRTDASRQPRAGARVPAPRQAKTRNQDRGQDDQTHPPQPADPRNPPSTRFHRNQPLHALPHAPPPRPRLRPPRLLHSWPAAIQLLRFFPHLPEFFHVQRL